MQNVVEVLKIRALSVPLLLAGLSLLAACGGVTPGELPFLEDAEELSWQLELQNASGGDLDLNFTPAAGDAAYREGGLVVVKDGVSAPVPAGPAFTLPADAKLAATLLCNATFTLNSGARMERPPSPPQPCPAENDAPDVVMLTGPVWRLVLSNPSQLPVQVVTQRVVYLASPTLSAGTAYHASTNTIVLAPSDGGTAGSFSALLPCSVEAVTSASGTVPLEDDGDAIQNGRLSLAVPADCEDHAGGPAEASAAVVRAYWELELSHAAAAGTAPARAVLNSADRTLDGGNYVYPPQIEAGGGGSTAAQLTGSGSDILHIAQGEKFVARILCGETIGFSAGIHEGGASRNTSNAAVTYAERSNCADRSAGDAYSITPARWTLALRNSGSAPLQAVLREADRNFGTRTEYYGTPQINIGGSNSPAALTNEDSAPGAETLTLAAGATFTAQLLCARADFGILSGIEENSGAQTYVQTGCADLPRQDITAARWTLTLTNNNETEPVTLVLADESGTSGLNWRDPASRDVYYTAPPFPSGYDQSDGQLAISHLSGANTFTAVLLCGVPFNVESSTGQGAPVDADVSQAGNNCGDNTAMYRPPNTWQLTLANPTQLPVTLVTAAVNYRGSPTLSSGSTYDPDTHTIVIAARAGNTDGSFMAAVPCSVAGVTTENSSAPGTAFSGNDALEGGILTVARPTLDVNVCANSGTLQASAPVALAYWELTLTHAEVQNRSVAHVQAVIPAGVDRTLTSGKYVYHPVFVGAAQGFADAGSGAPGNGNAVLSGGATVEIDEGRRFIARILCGQSLAFSSGIEGGTGNGAKSYSQTGGAQCTNASGDDGEPITPARWELVLRNTSGAGIDVQASEDPGSTFPPTRYYAIPQLTDTSDGGSPADASIASGVIALADGRKLTAALRCGAVLTLSGGVATGQRSAYTQATNCGNPASEVALTPAIWTVILSKPDTSAGAALTLETNGYLGRPALAAGSGSPTRPGGSDDIMLPASVEGASVQVLCTQAFFGLTDGADGHLPSGQSLAANSPLTRALTDFSTFGVCNEGNTALAAQALGTDLQREHWQLELANSAGGALTVDYEANTNIYAVDVSGSGWDSSARTIEISGSSTATIRVACTNPPATSNFVIDSESTAQADDPTRTTTGEPTNCGASNEATVAGITLLSALLVADTPSAAFNLAAGGSANYQYDATNRQRVFIYTTDAVGNDIQLRVSQGTNTYADTAHLGLQNNAAVSFTAAATARHIITITNNGGSQANGLRVVAATPSPISAGVQAISRAADHGCFLLGGALSCVGRNVFGELGAGLVATGDQDTSERISLLRPVIGLGSGVRAFSAGAQHTCAALQNGQARCWGNATQGQLGNNAASSSATPVTVVTSNTDPSALSGVQAISAGLGHTCAIVRSGSDEGVQCWGLGAQGQLGVGALPLPSPPDCDATFCDTPHQVSGLTSGVTAISAGGGHTCAIVSESIYCWGAGPQGQLGIPVLFDTCSGFPGTCVHTPQQLSSTEAALAISAGTAHTCAIFRTSADAQRALCWGEAEDGKLGIGPPSDTCFTVSCARAPQEVTGLSSGVSAISAGDDHTCAIHDDGSGAAVKCWGLGDDGRLGNGNTSGQEMTPVVVNVSALGSFVPARLAVGHDAEGSCALSAVGQPYCWGFGEQGVLGNGENVANNATPVALYDSSAFDPATSPGSDPKWRVALTNPAPSIQLILATSTNSITLNEGATHTETLDCATHATFTITSGADGHTLTAYRPFGGACVLNNPPPSTTLALARPNWQLVLTNTTGSQLDVTHMPNTNIYARNGAAFTSTGTLMVPANSSVTLSIACVTASPPPFEITGGALASEATTSQPASCGSSSEGAVAGVALMELPLVAGEPSAAFTLEANDSAPGGLDTATYTYNAVAGDRVFVYTTGPAENDIRLSVAHGSPVVMDAEDTANLGLQNNAAVSFTAAATGRHTITVTNNGGNPAAGLAVVVATPPPIGAGVQAISRLDHTCFLLGGALSCVGNNHHGRLGVFGLAAMGNPSTSESISLLRPLAAPLDGGVTAVRVGYRHTCAIQNGDAYCWGNGAEGRLGNGDASSRSTPTAVGSINGAGDTVLAISAGFEHTCAIVRGGSGDRAMCWGGGSSGQLGNGGAVFTNTTPQQVSPATSPAVAFDTGVTAISTGERHTCAIQNGDAYCWGRGGKGQLGIGTPPDICGTDPCATTPQAVSSINGAGDTVLAISTGSIHTCAIVRGGSDDRAMCWGWGQSGQLGNGGTTDSNVPVQVGVGANALTSGVSAISAGIRGACAIHDDGGPTVKCWGDGRFGQLGDGTNGDFDCLGSDGVLDCRRTPNNGVSLPFPPARFSTGAGSNCALSATGQPHCWGAGHYGTLGNGNPTNQNRPVALYDSSAFDPATAPQTNPTWEVVLSNPAPSIQLDLMVDGNSITLNEGATQPPVTLSCETDATYTITAGADGAPLTIHRPFAGSCATGTASNPVALERPNWQLVLTNTESTQLDVTHMPNTNIYARNGAAFTSTGTLMVPANSSVTLSIACVAASPPPFEITGGASASTATTSQPADCGLSSEVAVDAVSLTAFTTWQVVLSHNTPALLPVRVDDATAAAIQSVVGGTGYSAGDNIIRVRDGAIVTVTLPCDQNFTADGNAAVDDTAASQDLTCGARVEKSLTPLFWDVRIESSATTSRSVIVRPHLMTGSLSGADYAGVIQNNAPINGASSEITLPSASSRITFSLLCSASQFHIIGGVSQAITRDAPSPCPGTAPPVITLADTNEPNEEEDYSLATIGAGFARASSPAYPANAGRLFVYTTGATDQVSLNVQDAANGNTQIPGLIDTNEQGVGFNAALAFDATAGASYTFQVVNDSASNPQSGITVHVRPALPVITGAQSISGGGRFILDAEGSYSCFVLEGAASCVGHNHYGQLGAGLLAAATYTGSDRVSLMRPVMGLSSGVRAINAGDDHACAVLQNGQARCWGRGNSGQLGDNDNTQEINATPVPVVDPNDVLNPLGGVTAISAGEEHTCAIVNGGAMCWGNEGEGRLGNGQTTGNFLTPQQVSETTSNPAVSFTSGVTAIGAGDRFTCAIRSGDAYCWGFALFGRLGNGGTSNLSVPTVVDATAIPAADTVLAISVGQAHTCAIISNQASPPQDRAMCWGFGGNGGRLGNGDNNNRDVPTQVDGLTSGVLAIHAGNNHTCAIHDDGLDNADSVKVKCWGAGNLGQLGNGGFGSPRPVDVLLPAGFVPASLSTGSAAFGSCAINATGRPLCWGEGDDGILGNGDPDDENTPQPVYDSSGFSVASTPDPDPQWQVMLSNPAPSITLVLATSTNPITLSEGATHTETLDCTDDATFTITSGADGAPLTIQRPATCAAASIPLTLEPPNFPVTLTNPTGSPLTLTYNTAADDILSVDTTGGSGGTWTSGSSTILLNAVSGSDPGTAVVKVLCTAASFNISGVTVSTGNLNNNKPANCGTNNEVAVTAIALSGQATSLWTVEITHDKPYSVPIKLDATTVAAISGNVLDGNSATVSPSASGTVYAVPGHASDPDMRKLTFTLTCTTAALSFTTLAQANSPVAAATLDTKADCATAGAAALSVSEWEIAFRNDPAAGSGTHADITLDVGVSTDLRDAVGANTITVASGSAEVTHDIPCHLSFTSQSNEQYDGFSRNAPGSCVASSGQTVVVDLTAPLVWHASIMNSGSEAITSFTFTPATARYTSAALGTLQGSLLGGATRTISVLCSIGTVTITGGFTEGSTAGTITIDRPLNPLGVGGTPSATTCGTPGNTAANTALPQTLTPPTISTPVTATVISDAPFDLTRQGLAGNSNSATTHTPTAGDRVFIYTEGTASNLDLQVTGPGSLNVTDDAQLGISGNGAVAFTAAAGEHTITVTNQDTSAVTGITVKAGVAPAITSGVLGIATNRNSTTDVYSCFFLTSGTSCVGDNTNLKLGIGSTEAGENVALMQPVDTTETILSISAGRTHACALVDPDSNTNIPSPGDNTSDDRVLCWGSDDDGQLGNGSLMDAQASPAPVLDTSDNALTGFTAISVGRAFTCAIMGGAPMCWGSDNDGKLGNGTGGDTVNPGAVGTSLTDVKRIVAGATNACLIDSSDTVQCWGRSDRTGSGVSTDPLAFSQVPTTVMLPGTVQLADATDISHGTNHACAIRTNGAVVCWGDDGDERLGRSDNPDIADEVTGLASGVTAVLAGNKHSCAVHNNVVKCWGDDQNGALGNDAALTLDTPTPMNVDFTGLSFTASGSTSFSQGYFSRTTCVIESGRPLCWGLGAKGILGDGSTTDAFVPVRVYDSSGF